jgi:hypothetical protein
LQFQRRKRGARRDVGISPEFVQVGDKIIGSAPWGAPGEPHLERFMVFTIRNEKIIDMQGFTSRRDAERFADRR